jgi:hypothetical protein
MADDTTRSGSQGGAAANQPETRPAFVRVAQRLWEDASLTTEQRVAAALDAGLALGERLAMVSPGTSEQVAYSEGWYDGWAAAEHDMAQEWRRFALHIKRIANQLSYAELAVRRGEA